MAERLESALEDELVRLLEANGYYAPKLTFVGRKAATDRLVLGPKTVVFSELKRSLKHSPTPQQQRMQRRLRDYGLSAHVLQTTPQLYRMFSMEKITHRKRTDLLPHQLEVASILTEHDEAIIVLDMGRGKTASTLTAFADRQRNFDASRALVITPRRPLLTVWEKEAKLWHHLQHLTFSYVHGTEPQRLAGLALAPEADITLCSFDHLVWLRNVLTNRELPWDVIVWDELSRLRSFTGKRYKLWRYMADRFPIAWGLTGTLRPKGYENLYSQFRIIDKGKRLGTSSKKFMKTYFNFDPWSHQHEIREESPALLDAKCKGLVHYIKPSKDLPEFVDTPLNIPTSKSFKRLYKQLSKDKLISLRGGAEVEAVNEGALYVKKMQLASGWMYLEDNPITENYETYNGPYVEVHREKLNTLEEIFEEVDRPLLISYWFKFEAIEILNRFDGIVNLSTISDAKLPKFERLWNSGKIERMLVHPASVGHGMNLHGSEGHIVHFTLPPGDAELFSQLNYRLRREGRKTPVDRFYLLMQDTIDYENLDRVVSRENNQNAFYQRIA